MTATKLAEKGTADWSDDDWQRAREIARESLEGEGIFEVEDEDVYSFPPVIDWVLDAVDNRPFSCSASAVTMLSLSNAPAISRLR